MQPFDSSLPRLGPAILPRRCAEEHRAAQMFAQIWKKMEMRPFLTADFNLFFNSGQAEAVFLLLPFRAGSDFVLKS